MKSRSRVFIAVLSLLVLPATLWAMDINQGKFELSGKTAFDFSDTTTEVSGQPDIDTTTYSIQLDGLYYIANNFGLGLILQYEKSEIEQGGFDTDISSLLIGPQVTYNFPLNEKVSLFVNGAFGYAEAEANNADADGWGWQVGAGLKYFLTNSASINGVLSYKALSLEDDFGNDFDVDGVSVGAGLSIYF